MGYTQPGGGMPIQPVPYAELRPHLQTGDVVAFGGTSFVSHVIKRATNSEVSHVGMVARFCPYNMPSIDFMALLESTTLMAGRSGVFASALSERLRSFDGPVWILSLSDEARARSHNKPESVGAFVLRCLGLGYDKLQAVLSAGKLNREDDNLFFCSELIARAFEECGVLGEMNASNVTPADLCALPIFSACYRVR